MSRGAAATKSVLVKLIVGAGQASPQPPVGPALGSKGVKAIDFCKDFNARTANFTPGVPIPVLLTVKPDRTFTYEMKSPPTTWLLKQAAGVEKGAADGKTKVGKISLKHVYEIAKVKKTDPRLGRMELESVCKGVIGTAASMGIEVVP